IYARSLTSVELYVGVVTGMFTFAALFTRFFTGPALDRFPRKLILLVGLLLSVVSNACYIISNNIEFLIAMRAVNGLGYGLSSAALATIVSTMLPPKRLLEGVGYCMMFNTLCGAVGPTIALNISNSNPENFHIVFVISTAFTALSVILAILLKPKSYTKTESAVPAEKQTNQTGKKEPSGFSLATVTLMILTFLLAFNHSSILACLNLYAMDAALGNLSLFFIIFALTNFTTRLLMNRLVERFGERRILIVITAMLILALYGIYAAESASLIFAMAMPLGIVMGFYYPMMSSKTLKTMNEKRQGTSNTLRLAAEDLAFSFGAVFWGMLSVYIGGYRYIYLIAAALAGLMLLIVLVYPSVLKKWNIQEDVWESSRK
ncbi:MAG: MFS transporter, partial [Peptococcaceae bacterium]|nr:MFS transporter [Peptococcaceae bacterium]